MAATTQKQPAKGQLFIDTDLDSAQPAKKAKVKSVAKKTYRNKAGLLFPYTRTKRTIKLFSSQKRRTSAAAAVVITAAAEYFVAELCELSTMACKAENAKHKRVQIRHLQAAVRGDPDLSTMLKRCTIAGAASMKQVPKKKVKSKPKKIAAKRATTAGAKGKASKTAAKDKQAHDSENDSGQGSD